MKNADKEIFSGDDGETMMKCLEATFVDQLKNFGIFIQCLECKQSSTSILNWKYCIAMGGPPLLKRNQTNSFVGVKD